MGRDQGQLRRSRLFGVLGEGHRVEEVEPDVGPELELVAPERVDDGVVVADLVACGLLDPLAAAGDVVVRGSIATRQDLAVAEVRVEQLSERHMVRNALRYASKQHWSAVTKQMRAIDTAHRRSKPPRPTSPTSPRPGATSTRR